MPSQFEVIVEQDEEGYFLAAVPELPGCYTQGRTRDEALELCLEEDPSLAARKS